MTSRNKELAKFFCGVEAFHALMHAYFWYTRTTLRVVGIKESPKWHIGAAVGHALAAVALGVYAWRDVQPRQEYAGSTEPDIFQTAAAEEIR